MILVDTSVWIDHFRVPNPELQLKVRSLQIIGHAFVTGELVAGSVDLRHRYIEMIRRLPQLQIVGEEAFYAFIEYHALNGKGASFVDLHLLAAVASRKNCLLWTRDKRLEAQAQRLGFAYTPD